MANTKESRKDEKYRCFLKNRDDDYFLGVSITPECNTLKTVEKSPERMRLKPVRSETVEHSCLLPENFTGIIFINVCLFMTCAGAAEPAGGLGGQAAPCFLPKFPGLFI